MQQPGVNPISLRVLSEQIYQYKKEVRQMVLCTFPVRYKDQAIERLERQDIGYIIQPVGKTSINLFFGRKECLDAIRLIVKLPLNRLTPEEDFILGTLLGYDICQQCKRYCNRKHSCSCCS